MEKKDWQKEWQDMPEFVQNKKEPYGKIIFRFETKEDLEAFAKLIGQNLTNKTKSSWYPYKPHVGDIDRRWVDET